MTTFAVVSGVTGAALPNQVILILGIANLLADGFSMAASAVLSLRSYAAVREAAGEDPEEELLRHGPATFGAFVSAGAVPLLAYILPIPDRVGPHAPHPLYGRGKQVTSDRSIVVEEQARDVRRRDGGSGRCVWPRSTGLVPLRLSQGTCK